MKYWIGLGATLSLFAPSVGHAHFVGGSLEEVAAMGLKHMATLFALGLFIAQTKMHTQKAALGFGSACLAGFLLALWGPMSIPADGLFTFSIVCLGLCLYLSPTLQPWPQVSVVGGVALCHGFIFGAAATTSAHLIFDGLSFLITTSGCLVMGVLSWRIWQGEKARYKEKSTLV